MFFEFEKKEADLIPGITYQDRIDSGKLSIKNLKSNLLMIESRTMGQQLVEVARADFNGDGIEDILLYDYSYAKGGTFGAGGITIITRKTENSLFEVLNETYTK